LEHKKLKALGSMREREREERKGGREEREEVHGHDASTAAGSMALKDLQWS
jgi:hypothetical protein